ncbi:MAG: phage major capsid protein [Clostridia bacterium]|nr:phage major capsid protein [Clostridia bacterium]
MVTFTNADAALKNYYLEVVSNQLNTKISPFYAKIKHSIADVWGKNVIKLVPYGVNGGVGAGTETGSLPGAVGNSYMKFSTTLKNLYGTIELSDKVIRASENNTGAFINLLNAEMEGLLKASKFNFGRMIYGDGSGKLTTTVDNAGNNDKSLIKVDSVKPLIEGMVIDIYATGGNSPTYVSRKILEIDRANNIIKIDGAAPSSVIGSGYFLTVQGSYNLELTGLGAIFGSTGSIYGISRVTNKWLVPYMKSSNGAISSATFQEAIDFQEEAAGSEVNYISAAYDVRRFYLDYLALTRTNVDYMNLDGGFKAISYNGIPVVADRFVENGTMYILNTDDFMIHQLSDWSWIEGDNGKILMQKPGTPTYTATLVKYADLICNKPIGQAKISGITAASA